MASSEKETTPTYTYSEEEKINIHEPLLTMWKVACVTNSPMTSAKTSPGTTAADYEAAAEINFLCAIPAHVKGAWVTMTEWYGKKDQKHCREWSDDGKRALVRFFVDLAKEVGLEKEAIVDKVYFGDTPTFEKVWRECGGDLVEGDASGTEASGTES